MLKWFAIVLLVGSATSAPIGEAFGGSEAEEDCTHTVSKRGLWDVIVNKAEEFKNKAEGAVNSITKGANEAGNAIKGAWEDTASSITNGVNKLSKEAIALAESLHLSTDFIDKVTKLIAGSDELKKLLSDIANIVTASPEAAKLLNSLSALVNGNADFAAFVTDILDVCQADPQAAEVLRSIVREFTAEDGIAGQLLREVIKVGGANGEAAKVISLIADMLSRGSATDLGPLIQKIASAATSTATSAATSAVPIMQGIKAVAGLLAEDGPLSTIVKRIANAMDVDSEAGRTIKGILDEVAGKGKLAAVAKPVLKALQGVSEPDRVFKELLGAVLKGADPSALFADLLKVIGI